MEPTQGEPLEGPAVARAARSVARATALLLDSGQTTRAVLSVAERVDNRVGTRLTVIPTWSQVQVTDPDGRVLAVLPVRPVAVHMARATYVQRHLPTAGMMTPDELESLLDRAQAQRASPTWAFALAAGLGAVMLSIISGADHAPAIALIFLAASAGGLARRALAAWGATAVAQTFAAALIGGLAGALAAHLGWTSAARLVAVCPGMVLVPGPQVLNGAIDIAERRHDMGLARLSDAALTVLTISAGVVGGLLIGGSNLPLDATTRATPLWLDVGAAAALALCYPVYFSMPWRTAGWSCLAGGMAHAVHWAALSWWGWDAPAASFAACLVASGLLTPVSRSRHIPFAGAGFAAVVALVPGVYLFRTAAGALELLSSPDAATLVSTATDLSTAVLIVLAMAAGLTVPYRLWTRPVRP